MANLLAMFFGLGASGSGGCMPMSKTVGMTAAPLPPIQEQIDLLEGHIADGEKRIDFLEKQILIQEKVIRAVSKNNNVQSKEKAKVALRNKNRYVQEIASKRTQCANFQVMVDNLRQKTEHLEVLDALMTSRDLMAKYKSTTDTEGVERMMLDLEGHVNSGNDLVDITSRPLQPRMTVTDEDLDAELALYDAADSSSNPEENMLDSLPNVPVSQPVGGVVVDEAQKTRSQAVASSAGGGVLYTQRKPASTNNATVVASPFAPQNHLLNTSGYGPQIVTPIPPQRKQPPNPSSKAATLEELTHV